MHVHFVGIGGIGVSALARFYRASGDKVTGSDMHASPLISELRREGIKVSIDHVASNVLPSADLVLYSAAVPRTNPELVKARKLGIETKSYAEAVGDLTRRYATFAVTGAHGKSTTTSLLALALVRAGLDPTVIVGTKLKEFGNTNFRKGKSGYLVLEADEYNRSFLHHSPAAAIILNIDREHLDTYRSLANVKRAFLKFANNIREGGLLAINRDDKNIRQIAGQFKKIARTRRLRLLWYSLKDFHGQFALKIPGAHNVSNALSVLTLLAASGIPQKPVIKALERYGGAWRRMEYRGRFNGIKRRVDVYDDYAHHPAEIRATILALREQYPRAHIVCVFQPHQAQRLKYLFREFASAFDDADALVLLDTYKVAGRDRFYKNRTAKNLADSISRRIASRKVSALSFARYLSSPALLRAALVDACTQPKPKNCVVAMMGAGDIVNYTGQIVKKARSAISN